MNEITGIVEQLRQVHEGEAWHGPSVLEALAGVSAAGAAKRPLAGAHTIWEIAHHVRVTEALVCSHVTGAAAGEEADWPTVTDTSDAAWRAACDKLAATQKALRDAVSKLPEARLHENIAGKSHSYYYELLGIIQHDLYHAGQISLLKKGI